MNFCKSNQKEMEDIYADVISTHTYSAADPNFDKQEMLAIFKEQVEIRHRIEDISPFKDDLVMAYGELGQAYFWNEMYEEALDQLNISMDLARNLTALIENLWFPTFTALRKGATLEALGRAQEAFPTVQEALDWRERKYGPKDSQSCR